MPTARKILITLLLAGLVQTVAAQTIQELSQGWKFAWNTLITADQQTDADLAALQVRTRPLSPSMHWDTPMAGYADLPVFGFGSYFLKVHVGRPEEPLGLEIGNISSSASIFWNGKELVKFGQVGQSAGQTRGAVRSSLLPLPALPDGQTDAWLVVQVANWLDHFPGMQTAPRIGALKDLLAERDRSIATTFMIFSIFAIMAIYHLFLYLFRRDERAPLYFALICLVLSLRILCTDRLYLNILIPDLPVNLIWIGSYLTFALLIPAFTLFVTNLFRYPINPVIRLVISVISLAYAVVVVTPMDFYTGLLLPFQIFCLSASLVLTILVVAALFGRRQHAGLFSLGFFAVLASTVFDIVKTNQQWNLPSLVPVGTVAFLFVLALVLSRKAAEVVHTAERLNHRLQAINTSMIRFVPRTFLKLLGKPEITSVALGDSHLVNASILVCRYAPEPGLNQNAHGLLDRLNGFVGEASSLIQRAGGTVVAIRRDGFEAVFDQGIEVALRTALGIAAIRNQAGCAPGIGIERGTVLLGLMGEDRYLNPAVLSELMQRAENLAGLAGPLGATVLLSQTTAQQIKGIENYQFRNLGNFPLSDNGEAKAVVEFFDADPRELWQAKRATRKGYEMALHLVLQGRRADGRQALEEHLAAFPGDKAAISLHAQITKLP